MTDPETKAVVTAPGDAPAASGDEQAPAKSRLSWAIGWIGVPLAVVSVIFGSGALIGAHFHDSWLARLIVWVVELFS